MALNPSEVVQGVSHGLHRGLNGFLIESKTNKFSKTMSSNNGKNWLNNMNIFIYHYTYISELEFLDSTVIMVKSGPGGDTNVTLS